MHQNSSQDNILPASPTQGFSRDYTDSSCQNKGLVEAKINCCFKHCTSNDITNTDVTFFMFPKDPDRFHQWVSATQRNDLCLPMYSKVYVCDKHFHTSQFSLNDGVNKKLLNKAVPSHDGNTPLPEQEARKEKKTKV